MDDVEQSVGDIAAKIRSLYGPLGQDLLVVTESQKLVTNSASRVLGLARPGSTIAKIVLSHIRNTTESLGDGSGTLLLLLDGALRFCAETLRQGRARRTELELCFMHIERWLLPRLGVPLLKSLRCEEASVEKTISGLVRAFCGANFPPDVCDQLRSSFWDWIEANARNTHGKASDAVDISALASAADRVRQDELVRVPAPVMASPHAVAGGGLSSSSVVRAHVLSGVLAQSSMPSMLAAGGVIIVDEVVAPLPVIMTAPEAMQAHLSETLLLTVERLWQAGVRAVLCAAEVHEEWRGALARRGILLLHLVDADELQLFERNRNVVRLKLTLGRSTPIEQIRLNSLSIRVMKPLEQWSSSKLASGRAFWVIEPAEPGPHCWLLLRAPSVGLAGEYRHALMRLLRVVSPFLKGGHVIHGGLAFEFNFARLVRSAAVEREIEPELMEAVGSSDSDLAQRVHSMACGILEAALLNVVEAFLSNLVTHSGAESDLRPRRIRYEVHVPMPPSAALRPPSLVALAALTEEDESQFGKHATVPLNRLQASSACRSRSRGVTSDAQRLARWLLVAAPEMLVDDGHLIGLQRVGKSTQPSFAFALSPGIGLLSSEVSDPEACLLETEHFKMGLLRSFCSLSRQLLRLDPSSLRCTASAAKGLQRAAAAVALSSDSESPSESD